MAKAAVRSVKDVAVLKPVPNQLGFGVQLGAEAVAHAAQSFLMNSSHGQTLLKTDFSNAFNTSPRE